MGVTGLLRHCLENERDVVTYGNLLQAAQERGGSLEILVDFYSFASSLMAIVNKKISTLLRNPYVDFLSAEYEIYNSFTVEYINVLRSVGVELVFYVDGSRGSCPRTDNYKEQTWKIRATQQYRRTEEVAYRCQNEEKLPPGRDHLVVPILGNMQMLESVHFAGAEVVYCSGEADTKLAHDFLQRSKAFAVLSNDSDFCLMKGCVFIPDVLFDTTDELGMKEPCLFIKNPRKLMVGVIKPADVATLLHLTCHSQLVDWAILRGNDFTGEFVRSLHQSLGVQGSECSRVLAAMVAQSGSLEKLPAVCSMLEKVPGFREAVEYCRWFYSGEQQPDGRMSTLGNMIQDQVARGQILPVMMSVHRGVYWHKCTNEVAEFGSVSIECALERLREILYCMLLDRQDEAVTEHGFIMSDQLQSFPVKARNLKTHDVKNLAEIQSMLFGKRLDIFHKVVGHIQENTPQYFQQFGLQLGFVCYVLRYLLTLDKSLSPGLGITKEEFVSVAAATIAGSSQLRGRFNGLGKCHFAPVIPDVRCMKLASWLQGVWLYLYGWLAKLLQIDHVFPKPREAFSGIVFVSFLMCKKMQGPCNMAVAEMARDSTVADNLEVLDAITVGITL